MTRRIIARDGIAGYLPTLLLPARRQVRVLEGVPASDDIEVASVQWAEREADADEDFLVAFPVDDVGFKVVARIDRKRHEVHCDV